MKNHPKKLQKGFTLLELIVSLGLFGIIAVMGLTTVLIVVSSNRTAESQSSVLSNLSSALEVMSRNIRVGSQYYCGSYQANTPPGDCPVANGGQTSMTFLSEDNKNWFTYGLSGSSIEKYVNGIDQGPVTSSEVKISSLTFFVQGSTNQNNIDSGRTQPSVIIVINGYISTDKGQVPLNIQTTVSQRLAL